MSKDEPRHASEPVSNRPLQNQPLQNRPVGHEPIWMRPTRQSQGHRPSLTREQIVRAAIALADTEGLEALTMRRLATQLGAGAMSLYWHIPNKDDLLDLMLDTAFAEVELPERPSGDWRTGLRLYARATRQALRRHSWLASFTGGRRRPGPNALRFAEFCLAAVDSLGLDIDTMVGIFGAVDAYTDGFAQHEVAEAQTQRRTGMTTVEWHAAAAPHLQELIASGRYPTLARLISAVQRVNTDEMADASFSFGLECLLDGIAARIASATQRESGDDHGATPHEGA